MTNEPDNIEPDDTKPDNIDDLQQRLVRARHEEQAAQQAAARDMQARELAYRRRRLADHRPEDYAQANRKASADLDEALRSDPLAVAFLEWYAAQWRQHNAAVTAHADANAIAVSEGREPAHDPGFSTPPMLTADALANVLGRRLKGILDDDAAARDEALTKAVLGSDLTPEQREQAQRDAEAAARHEAAKSVAEGSTDVTGMTEADRERLGLPPGMPPKQVRDQVRQRERRGDSTDGRGWPTA